MRIALVEPAGRGGLIHYAFQLGRALASAGAEPTLITDRRYELAALAHPFRLRAELDLWDPKPAGGEGGLAPSSTWRRAVRGIVHYREWLRLVGILRRERPDVALLSDIRFPTDLAPLLALRASGLRVADVCHNVRPFAARTGLPRAPHLEAALFARIYRRFDAVFVHGEANRRELVAAHGLDPARVVPIPHGNESLFAEMRAKGPDAAALRRGLGIPPTGPVVLLFGTLSRYKGVDLALQAFARVREREPRARLVVAGFPAPDFDLAGHRALAAELGLGDTALFVPGYVEASHVASWMEMAQVAVFPYRAVYQSGALHLAMTFGVPVVASRAGAMGEAVLDGESALLVDPGDVSGLTAAVLRVLGDAALASRLGRRAREMALTACSWDRIAATVLERCRAIAALGTPAGRPVEPAPTAEKRVRLQ